MGVIGGGGGREGEELDLLRGADVPAASSDSPWAWRILDAALASTDPRLGFSEYQTYVHRRGVCACARSQLRLCAHARLTTSAHVQRADPLSACALAAQHSYASYLLATRARETRVIGGRSRRTATFWRHPLLGEDFFQRLGIGG